MRRLQVRSVQNHGLYSRDPQGKFQIERIRICLIPKTPSARIPKLPSIDFTRCGDSSGSLS